MKVERVFTKNLKDNESIFDSLEWKKFNVSLKDHRSNKILFELNDVEAPAHWSQQSIDIMVSKYFRRSGVPTETKKSPKLPPNVQATAKEAKGWPEWIMPSVSVEDSDHKGSGETSVKQVLHRLVGTWTFWGWIGGYFNDEEGKKSEEYAKAFYDETMYMLYHQMAAPNSPQFFNTGLWWAYGIEGKACGHKYTDADGKVHDSPDLYSHSQAHACFILGLKDNLLDEGGIYDLLKKEARIFKLGSGAGTNFSSLRAEGESLSGGGSSSGLMSFLRIFDRAADCIKSGGICLCADTKIPTEDGVFTIKQLTDAGSSPRIYSWDSDTSQTVLRPVKEVFQSKDKECVKLVFEDGGIYQVTFDHPFLLTDGRYCAASKVLKEMDKHSCVGFGRSENVKLISCEGIGNKPVYNLSVDAENEEDRNYAIVF
jgi:hypothetical protein